MIQTDQLNKWLGDKFSWSGWAGPCRVYFSGFKASPSTCDYRAYWMGFPSDGRPGVSVEVVIYDDTYTEDVLVRIDQAHRLAARYLKGPDVQPESD